MIEVFNWLPILIQELILVRLVRIRIDQLRVFRVLEFDAAVFEAVRNRDRLLLPASHAPDEDAHGANHRNTANQ